MKLSLHILFFCLMAPLAAQATVADQIAALEKSKTQTNWSPALPDLGLPQARSPSDRPPHMMTLTDGREVNLNHYAIVVFMQRGCPYSAKFEIGRAHV